MKKHLKEKRDYLLTLQFKEFINAISTLLSTGYALENAISQSKSEVTACFGQCLMSNEISVMENKLLLHIPPEEIFKDFASRTDIEDIQNFSEILNIAKQTGGNIINIILSTSSSISTKIDTMRDIQVNLSEKKHELLIMGVMPVIIIIYISLTQPGFFNPVYDNVPGITAMSFCLFLYLCALLAAHKIISDIK